MHSCMANSLLLRQHLHQQMLVEISDNPLSQAAALSTGFSSESLIAAWIADGLAVAGANKVQHEGLVWK